MRKDEKLKIAKAKIERIKKLEEMIKHLKEVINDKNAMIGVWTHNGITDIVQLCNFNNTQREQIIKMYMELKEELELEFDALLDSKLSEVEENGND